MNVPPKCLVFCLACGECLGKETAMCKAHARNLDFGDCKPITTRLISHNYQ